MPNEMPDGGAFILDATLRKDPDAAPGDPEPTKLFGGRVVNSQGDTLREFAPDEVNTGLPDDGDEPVRMKAARPHARKPSRPAEPAKPTDDEDE